MHFFCHSEYLGRAHFSISIIHQDGFVLSIIPKLKKNQQFVDSRPSLRSIVLRSVFCVLYERDRNGEGPPHCNWYDL